ncbi:hypothetical protein MXAN_5227 [Myxococcus xanthus DK 1622]|uniref:Uncharacterized protein n=1 Tax=Myxococcus xanthus (strain DK1622) TaxID=246197 RepID=Q1D1U4_MYXXD|nr:hypothetical protein MXAN_5227 [Myxococcus xanthus DK 1622]
MHVAHEAGDAVGIVAREFSQRSCGLFCDVQIALDEALRHTYVADSTWALCTRGTYGALGLQ